LLLETVQSFLQPLLKSSKAFLFLLFQQAPEAPIYVVGNKTDAERDRMVAWEDGVRLFKRINCRFRELSGEDSHSRLKLADQLNKNMPAPALFWMHLSVNFDNDSITGDIARDLLQCLAWTPNNKSVVVTASFAFLNIFVPGWWWVTLLS